MLRGGWETAQRKSLLRNNCDGSFTDVTKEAGLAMPTSTQAAVWLDINNDGYLDLFVGNENGPSQLFLNQGDGTFVDIAHAAGVDRVAFSKGAVAVEDYDHDGYVDLYVSNYRGDNALFRNNHDLTFTGRGATGRSRRARATFPVWFFDYDNDGWEDLLVTSYNMSVAEMVRNFSHCRTMPAP